MTEHIPEAEAFIRFRLEEMAARNEHHRFEEVATRIARKRISSNILIARGPVSAGGDQQRDAESYTTRIPDELPHSAGFSATASTSPVVIACTVQKDRLKNKVLADLAGICAEVAAPVSHVAFFSVHPIPAAASHDLQMTARETYGVTLDIFCGSDLATMLAEQDLVWVARHYLELPSAMVPPPEGEPAPEWYSELLENLRRNRGPAALTPGTQGEVTQGLRFATWDADANADLPEWLDFMGAFLADNDVGKDTEIAFRACYEMAVARFRGMGVAAGVEDLVRRAVAFACTSSQPNVLDDAATLVSYWGVMWSSGVGRAEVPEIADALARLRAHVGDALEATDPATHPVRSASLTGTMAFLHLVPDCAKAEQERGRPTPVEVAANVGVRLDDFEIDTSALTDSDLVDLTTAMQYLERLVDLLPNARPYSVRQLARVFGMFAPAVSREPNYAKVRDGLDAAIAAVEGGAAIADRCRNRGMAFAKVGRPLEALVELHNAKVNWFHGDTMYGSILTMRYLGHLYSGLGLTYAAKMYACSAATMAIANDDPTVKAQTAEALLEAARYAQDAGCWIDAAGLTEIALLARHALLPDPFDYDKHPELSTHELNATLELGAIRSYWPELEPLIERTYGTTGWYQVLAETVAQAENALPWTEGDFQKLANDQLAGPVLGDIGPTRVIDFRALGVRWIFTFNNDRTTALTTEGLSAGLQVLLADIARYEPVIIKSTVNVNVEVIAGAPRDADDIVIDDSTPEIVANVVLSDATADLEARVRALVAMCFQLVDAVHVRPPGDLQELLELLFKDGLSHKVSVGRPYEEAAALLAEEHYERCAAHARPLSSDLFNPVERGPLAASTAPGTGYDRNEALRRIRERYEVASETLRYSVARLLADESGRETIVRLRDEGWLDWQILVSMGNAAWNWRMQRAGITPGFGDRSAALRLATASETPTSSPIPLNLVTGEELDLHLHTQVLAVAKRWGLRGRSEERGEGAMRDLLTRRYQYAVDDVPHRDLLDCLDEAGNLLPIIDPMTTQR